VPKLSTHLVDLEPDEGIRLLAELGQPKFRLRQLQDHYFRQLHDRPEQMTDLPAQARGALVERLLPPLLTQVTQTHADQGQTTKTLWRLAAGGRIETVLMRYPKRNTVCISSQAGCGMGCPFCATGQGGLERNLSAAEIVDQVVRAARLLRDPVADAGAEPAAALRLSNVVFMGMGEPLANYRQVVRAARVLCSPAPTGLGLPARQLTISTVGLAPAMKRLAAENMPWRLALSLHAADDDLRTELVPVNERWPIAVVLGAAREYFEATGRRVSIEYALIAGKNDQPAQAKLLARQLNRLGSGWAHVNAIRLNPTPGSSLAASSPAAAEEFLAQVRKSGIAATLRDTRGQEIAAACGQLAATTSDI
jgi:23S rRNA (adenine2503-C2)-methyltransferase